MKERGLFLLSKLMKILVYVLIGIWSLLTMLVFVTLIYRSLNPGRKSISHRDLKEFGIISLVFLITIGSLHFIRLFIKK